ncbi:lipoyl(octanoyl) transferase LipB [Marinobacter xestospongiae]|uniref:Octanoyltransferase n=1 Tax=Marinobacter xestospongiae TaxID=994319 RepID=A0ABU3VT83_9GAMM|nr:lipoyl(octanoyl) transferase LipB [Marinobacter xestospongiae]MCG8518987.1 lipoyl(octanoyl) transferase LipB [Pseudomonadales bacterium]MDV2077467.1 lipoyl(octanoyl) transferase LipB [Marinobacter xestospongiae]
MTALVVRNLGLQPYAETLQAMQQFTAQRDADTLDELWCLEHPPVFTQGQAGKAEHLLAPGDIPVIQVDRGGQVTYHGPGQLVVYLMIDLKRRKLGIRDLVDHIEQAIVAVLAPLGIESSPRADAPGVYVGEAKIASLGLRVRRGCSFHGLALNIDMDMAPFRRINPCGYAGLAMCQVRDFAAGQTVAALATSLSAELARRLGAGDVRHEDGWAV